MPCCPRSLWARFSIAIGSDAQTGHTSALTALSNQASQKNQRSHGSHRAQIAPLTAPHHWSPPGRNACADTSR